jgi:hypothetical protein
MQLLAGDYSRYGTSTGGICEDDREKSGFRMNERDQCLFFFSPSFSGSR